MTKIFKYEGPADGLLKAIESNLTKCETCHGEGYIHQQNGPEDYDQVECANCNASGFIETTPF